MPEVTYLSLSRGEPSPPKANRSIRTWIVAAFLTALLVGTSWALYLHPVTTIAFCGVFAGLMAIIAIFAREVAP